MQRFIFQTPVVTRDGLYSYLPLTLEQARIWLSQGEAPAFRLPLIGSVIQTLTSKDLAARPGERLFMHTGDEALIVLFDFPETRYTPAYQRGQVATQARALSLADVRDHVRFALLKKFAKLDSYIQSITQWDSAFRDRRWRYLVHDAVLTQYGVYQFGRIAVAEATAWLDEAPFESLLRYDATCKALELISDSEVTLWETSGRATLSMEPGDQALVAFLHAPGEAKPKPFEPFRGQITREYALSHTSLSLLTRLSSEFFEVNARIFPAAALLPGDNMRVREH